MKYPILFFFLLSAFACTKSVDFTAEKESIMRVLDEETRSAAKGDRGQWASFWLQNDDATFTYTNSKANGLYHFVGWKNIESQLPQSEPFDLKLQRDNYKFMIENALAFVTFDQEDNWGGTQTLKKRESRTLQKVDGEWKIVNTNVIEVSSYGGRIYRRILLMKFKEGFPKERIGKIKTTFESLSKSVQGFERFQWIQNQNIQVNDPYTHTLVLDFNTVQAVADYEKHGDHLWLMKEGTDAVANISATDYWVK
jgi:hypothetical protein